MDTRKSNIPGPDDAGNELNIRIKTHLKAVLDEDIYSEWIEDMLFLSADSKCVVAEYYGSKPLALFNRQYKEEVLVCICSVVGYSKKLKISRVKIPIIPDFDIEDSEADEPEKPPVLFDEPNIKPEVKGYGDETEENMFHTNTKRKRNIKAAKLFIISAIFVFLAVVIAVIACNYITNRKFTENFYSVSSLKADNRVRVIQISDLHNCNYGKNNKTLTERVEKLSPDLIICTGDILDSNKNRQTEVFELCEKLAQIAPSYYIYGNNEVERIYDFALNQTTMDKKFGFDDENRDASKLLEVEDNFEKELEKTGINVLKNEVATLSVGTTNIDVFGILTSNPSAFWSYSGQVFESYIYENPDNIKITAVHEPYIFEEFEAEFWGDLILCGHTHGGTVRVPFVGPLYTHEAGLFPEKSDAYVYGRYSVAGKPIILSSGLENSNLLRINNQPELVIVDINKF